MKTAENSQVPQSRPWTIYLIGAALSALWIQFIWLLRYNWDSDSSYNYGWLVPPLALLLAYQAVRGSRFPRSTQRSGTLGRLVLLSAVSLGLVCFTASQLLVDINPFWRLPLWAGGLSLVTLTFGTLALWLGLPRAKTLVFPLLFTLTMIPWPVFAELIIIESFTGVVTLFSVESLHWLGEPAEQFGNVIRIGSAVIGVEEACSGIKSLQALAVMALFLGSYWQLTLKRRLGLLVAAAAFAFVFNFARTLTLSLIVINAGQESMDNWHDPVGHVAFGLGLGLLLFTAHFLAPKSAPVASQRIQGESGRFPQPSPKLASALFLAAFAPLLSSALWYNDNASNSSSSEEINWLIQHDTIGTERYQLQSLPIHKRIAENLGFDYGEHFRIESAEARNSPLEAELWYYGFDGSSRSKSLSAYAHSPTICMTSSGAVLIAKREPLHVDLGPLEIPFQHFVFELPDGRESQVFWCLWDDLLRGKTEDIEGDFRLAQITAAFSRSRSFERKVALIGLPQDDPSIARNEVTHLVRNIFSLEQNGRTFRYD